MYLLDTNIISETRRVKPHPAVASWLRQIPASQLFVPAIVFEELQTGVELVRRQDEVKAREIEVWIEALERSAQVVQYGAKEARCAARFLAGKTKDVYADAAIAATAHLHALTVVTRNSRDFEIFGVSLFNPFAGPDLL